MLRYWLFGSLVNDTIHNHKCPISIPYLSMFMSVSTDLCVHTPLYGGSSFFSYLSDCAYLAKILRMMD